VAKKTKRAKLDDDDEDSPSIDAFYNAYREKLLIDKNAMDDMWLEQPSIYQEIGERLALEISLRDQAKDDLADIAAELDTAVRELHADDDKKPTETALKNEIKQDKTYKSALARQRALELNVSRLQMLRDSFHQRRYALQDLTTLWTGGYFTSNSGAAKDARERKHMSIREAQQAERKRRENKGDE
jgi:hypothetical protein